jgi:hypothetical protein
LIFFSLALLLNTARFRAAIPASPEQRAIDFNDAAAWKGVNATALADRGDWFAYRLSPQEGDSSITIRETNGIKEYKFSIGEIPAAAGGPPAGGPVGGGAALAISSDSKYAAFTMFPSHAEAAQLKRQRKPIQSKVGIVNLETGEKLEVAKVRRFLFSGENGAWIALQKYGPDAPGGAAAVPPAAGPAGAAARDDRPKGADLLLRELATGQEINIGNVSEFAFDKHGRFLAWITDATDKSGNGISLRNVADPSNPMTTPCIRI